MSISLIKALNTVEVLTWHQRSCLKAIAEFCKYGNTTHRVKYGTVSKRTGIPIRTLSAAVKAGKSAGCLSTKRSGRSNYYCWHIGQAESEQQTSSSRRTTVQGSNKSLFKGVTDCISEMSHQRDKRSLTDKILAAFDAIENAEVPSDVDSLLKYAGVPNSSIRQQESARKILLEKRGYQHDQQNGRDIQQRERGRNGT